MCTGSSMFHPDTPCRNNDAVLANLPWPRHSTACTAETTVIHLACTTGASPRIDVDSCSAPPRRGLHRWDSARADARPRCHSDAPSVYHVDTLYTPTLPHLLRDALVTGPTHFAAWSVTVLLQLHPADVDPHGTGSRSSKKCLAHDCGRRLHEHWTSPSAPQNTFSNLSFLLRAPSATGIKLRFLSIPRSHRKIITGVLRRKNRGH